MDFKTHLETALKLTLQYISPLILMTLGLVGVSALTLGILAPVVLAGYIQAILLMIREGREPKIQDIFSQMKLLLPLVGFGVVVFITAMIGFAMFFLPGLLVIAAVSFGCLYMIPLMTDKGLGLLDAIKQSFEMATKNNVMDHVIVLILVVAISSIGSSVIVGILFTQPFATVFLMGVYEEKIRLASGQPHI